VEKAMPEAVELMRGYKRKRGEGVSMAKHRVKARKGDTVKVHYTCRLANGAVIDASVGTEPLEFTLGNNNVIRGLEEAVAGMKVGESKTAMVTADKAYGPYHDEWVLEVARDKFTEGWSPEIGLHYEVPRENGQSTTATVMRVSSSSVTLDFNHPMAGKELIFEIRLLEIV
jgi:peptidylprolyl isomerase